LTPANHDGVVFTGGLTPFIMDHAGDQRGGNNGCWAKDTFHLSCTGFPLPAPSATITLVASSRDSRARAYCG